MIKKVEKIASSVSYVLTLDEDEAVLVRALLAETMGNPAQELYQQLSTALGDKARYLADDYDIFVEYELSHD